MSILSSLKEFWNSLKTADPLTLRTEYIDIDVKRERKPIRKTTKFQKHPFFTVFNFYPSNYSTAEKKLLLKFDISVFLFMCASTFTKNLDNANISTAYVSGMKEDIHVVGNELNIFSTMYTVGYALFQIPLTLLITKPQLSRYLLIICEFAWGILTLGNAFVKTPQQVYAIRFLIGVTEACSYPASYVIFSSYLTDQELFTRAGFYGAFGTAGSAVSGSLQTRMRDSLEGVCGLAGWRWQFIMDFVLTMGVTVYGFFLFPGIPTSCRKFGLFTEDDMIFARKRVEKKIAIPRKFDRKALKETFGTWQLYAFTILQTLHHSCYYFNGGKLYMASRKDLYTTDDVTNWHTYMSLIGIPCAIFISPLVEWLGKLPVVFVIYIIGYYAAIVTVFWNVKESVLLSSFFLIHVVRDGLSQVYYAWAASLCRDDVEKKALVLSIMQAICYATNSWVTPLQYNTKWSPRFKVGYIANLVIVICTSIWFVVTWILDHYDLQLIPKYAGHRHLDKEGNMQASESQLLNDNIINIGNENVQRTDSSCSLIQSVTYLSSTKEKK